MKHSFMVALGVIAIWIIARVTVAVAVLALHLLWMVAVIFAMVWVIGRILHRV